MSALDVPCIELAILVLLAGAAIVRRQTDSYASRKWSVVASGCALVLCLVAWQANVRHADVDPNPSLGLLGMAAGRTPFGIDVVSAPLLPVAALLHFLTFVSTQRTKIRRFSFPAALASEAIALATFACTDRWTLIALLVAGTIPPYLELKSRQRPTGVYTFHMGLFAVLLVVGECLIAFGPDPSRPTVAAIAPLALAILIRCGIVPFHCWLTDLFEHATFGTALLRGLPFVGMYAAFRLMAPIAPEGLMGVIADVATISAVYAAGMSLIQREARRFFCFLFLSLSAPVLVGFDSETQMGVAGALSAWISTALSLGGFGLMLRALEARFGRLSLASYHGFYEHTPTIAVCFALTGLACIGFPGTVGFVGLEMLIDGVVETHPYAGVALVLSTALSGIAAVRAYFLLFTGTRHASDVPLHIRSRERIAVLTLTALLLGGGLWAQPWIASRHRAAEQFLHHRDAPHVAQRSAP